MDDPQITPDSNPAREPFGAFDSIQPETSSEATAAIAPLLPAAEIGQPTVGAREDAAARRRNFRRNLYLLLSLALTAFVLTSWILVRVDSPFGALAAGPQEIVQAQLRALDRGELRPAYDMFSPRYRGQVSFDTWHQLFIRHWRMFHADVVRTESPSISGPGVTLEIYLHGADDKEYRARFSLVRSDGRWWIDDVHWTQEPDAGDVSRI